MSPAGRLEALLLRWGLLDHPYGRAYVRERYTLLGRRRRDDRDREGST